MAICGCPDAVVRSLRKLVQTELDKVRAIINATQFFDQAVADIIGLAGADIDVASAAIPTASPIDFTDLVEYALCPLLPLAIGLELADFQDFDPTTQLQKVKALQVGDITEARKAYEATLLAGDNAKIVTIAPKYTKELERLRFDATTFAKAILISATVLTICGQAEYQAGPYEEFATVIQDFDMGNGVPSGLSQNAAAVVQKLQQAEAKFKALRATIT